MAHRQPVREVSQRVQVALAGMGRVAATPQPRHVGGNVGGQRAFEQPGAQGRLQSRNLDHDGLQKWDLHWRTDCRFMFSAAGRRYAHCKPWRGLSDYPRPKLLITGGFS